MISTFELNRLGGPTAFWKTRGTNEEISSFTEATGTAAKGKIAPSPIFEYVYVRCRSDSGGAYNSLGRCGALVYCLDCSWGMGWGAHTTLPDVVALRDVFGSRAFQFRVGEGILTVRYRTTTKGASSVRKTCCARAEHVRGG